MSRVTTLRMRHPVHWLFGRLVPWSSSRTAKPVSTMFYVLLALASVMATLVSAYLWGFNGLLAGPAVLVAGVFLRIRPVASSVTWCAGGAGRAVLEIGDGRVRGRLRPLWSDERTDPVDRGWWDLDIAASDLIGVRVDRHHAGPTLVLDLPPAVAADLYRNPALTPWIGVWRDRVGSPAAWQVGTMLPLVLRDLALRGLLSALEREGAPVPASR